jgi:ABC-2 type transport system ATP-binding protein
VSVQAGTPQQAEQLAIHARGLVKDFETKRALDRVDLTMRAGEVRGLLGPNGAGKTTLLRILFGLVRPEAGSAELFGHPVNRAEENPAEGIAGFVETPSFYPYLSGRGNLELLAELDAPGASRRVDEALQAVKLSDAADRRVSGYSTGMLQRLGIGAALLRAPRLVLLDEPTAGLDPAGVRDVAALVRRLADGGVAVLLSSHQIGELEELCESFTVLRDGVVVWDGTAQRLRAEAPPSAYSLNTSDDARSVELLERHPRVRLGAAKPGGSGPESLTVTADQHSLDAYVLALAGAGVAIRRLELLRSPLESMFFMLTEDGLDA